MKKKYEIIYADPPWKHLGRYRSKTGKRDSAYYSRMTTKELCALPVKDIAATPSVLFMWTTDARLRIALQVMQAWGFKYKTVAFTWVKLESTSLKPVQIVSPWFMKSTEMCLLGVRGKIHPHKLTTVPQLLMCSRTKHSEKPLIIGRRISLMFQDHSEYNKVELFARSEKSGWDVWGNEVKCDIEL